MESGFLGERIVVTSMVDAVVDRLRAMVLGGALGPGDLLPSERLLSQELGASRNVVREALGVLRVEGLVEVQRGKGSVIGSPGPRTAGSIPRTIGRSWGDGTRGACGPT